MRATPQTLATPARRSSDWRPARQSLAYGGSDYQSLDRSRRSAWPGSGHARTPPPGAADAHQAHHAASSATSAGWPTGPARRSPTRRRSPQASAEIDRLKHARPQQPDRGPDRAQADRRRRSPPARADAARVREHEISGHGSSATWAHNRHHEPEPHANPPGARRTAPSVGKRTELARYTVAEGERVAVRPARRRRGPRHRPPRGRPGGRAYLVERDLSTTATAPSTRSSPTTSPRPQSSERPRWPAAPGELPGGDRMNWQEPDDERSNEPSADFDDLGSRRWPLDWHSLYPRERWIWFEQLWTDVCMLRERYRLPVRSGLVGAPAPGRGARRTSGLGPPVRLRRLGRPARQTRAALRHRARRHAPTRR